MEKLTFSSSSYVPKYSENYFNLPSYKRDMMTYYDYLKYKEMSDNPENYFSKKKVVNFDLIHHQCRGDPLLKPEKDHKIISSDDFKKYPQQEKTRLFLLFPDLIKMIYGLRETVLSNILRKTFSILMYIFFGFTICR